jgi:hypothetical protein
VLKARPPEVCYQLPTTVTTERIEQRGFNRHGWRRGSPARDDSRGPPSNHWKGQAASSPRAGSFRTQGLGRDQEVCAWLYHCLDCSGPSPERDLPNRIAVPMVEQAHVTVAWWRQDEFFVALSTRLGGCGGLTGRTQGPCPPSSLQAKPGGSNSAHRQVELAAGDSASWAPGRCARADQA